MLDARTSGIIVSSQSIEEDRSPLSSLGFFTLENFFCVAAFFAAAFFFAASETISGCVSVLERKNSNALFLKRITDLVSYYSSETWLEVANIP